MIKYADGAFMFTFIDLLKNFFTHKDFLPSADKMPGTLFTPLHFAFSAVLLAMVILFAVLVEKKSEKTMRTVFAVVWILCAVLEPAKIIWETYCGNEVWFEWGGILPLYPCSIFMYAMPFAIWGRGKVRYAACGYVCTLGLLGSSINFLYPANILSNYSCISFAGFHTFFYHGVMLFCALAMLISGYHSVNRAEKWSDLVLPAVPALCVSLAANVVNFSKIGSDYMFFRLNSFFFAPIGAALPTPVCVLIVYVLYLIIHTVPYLPGFIKNRMKARTK
jgi:hypothetical protein